MARALFMRGIDMITKKLAGILILLFIFILGCAADTGNYGNIKKQSGTEDKITLAGLRDNWNEGSDCTNQHSFRSPVDLFKNPSS